MTVDGSQPFIYPVVLPRALPSSLFHCLALASHARNPLHPLAARQLRCPALPLLRHPRLRRDAHWVLSRRTRVQLYGGHTHQDQHFPAQRHYRALLLFLRNLVRGWLPMPLGRLRPVCALARSHVHGRGAICSVLPFWILRRERGRLLRRSASHCLTALMGEQYTCCPCHDLLTTCASLVGGGGPRRRYWSSRWR
ncbi:hypothetical protein BDZ90DRAFT_187132 [Jaminaea rosea]|uniref:Uncharacterized protein n=1 Tax=Jaminaea rosea TaxID=1569628 RepID=A0A316UQA6_9BASI|nr:hypothetical protein BDZ90DRAFT_187132 [Jaminaea rosea]PWN27154.1 hypothetical protein BDZ90DRAFT_187132 [Jaminaea rosea]